MKVKFERNKEGFFKLSERCKGLIISIVFKIGADEPILCRSEALDIEAELENHGITIEGAIDYIDDIISEEEERDFLLTLFHKINKKTGNELLMLQEKVKKLVDKVEKMRKCGKIENVIYAVSELKFAKYLADIIKSKITSLKESKNSDYIFGRNDYNITVYDIAASASKRREIIGDEIAKTYKNYGRLSARNLGLL